MENSETQLRSARLAMLKRQWQPVVHNIVAACRGDEQAAERVSPLLDRLKQFEDWRELTGVLGRIMEGERDPGPLLDGLDPTDTLIAGNVLKHLGVDLSGSLPSLLMLENIPESGQHLGDLTLVDFVTTVVDACRADAKEEEVERVLSLTAALSADGMAPETLRTLARVLTDLLMGEDEIDLAALPDELRNMVTGVAASLLQRQVASAEA